MMVMIVFNSSDVFEIPREKTHLSLRHPNYVVLAGANSRNVIITYRFLAAPVRANQDFF